MDRGGKKISDAGPPGSYFQGFSLSPNEQHIAVRQIVNNNSDVYIMDLARGGLLTVTVVTNWLAAAKQVK